MTGDNKNNIFKNKLGYAFIEMLVAITLFSFVFLMISTIYLSMVEAQRSVIATQDIQESMKFIFEVVSKETRSARVSDNSCEPLLPATYSREGSEKKIFNKAVSGANNLLYFENKYGDCVFYFLENDADGVSRLKIQRGTGAPVALYVTPNDIKIENLDFLIYDDDVNLFHSKQAYITLRMDVEMQGGKEIHRQRTSLQTTISSRYYE